MSETEDEVLVGDKRDYNEILEMVSSQKGKKKRKTTTIKKPSKTEERSRREERNTEQKHKTWTGYFPFFQTTPDSMLEGSLGLKLQEQDGGRRVRLLVTLLLQ